VRIVSIMHIAILRLRLRMTGFLFPVPYSCSLFLFPLLFLFLVEAVILNERSAVKDRIDYALAILRLRSG